MTSSPKPFAWIVNSKTGSLNLAERDEKNATVFAANRDFDVTPVFTSAQLAEAEARGREKGLNDAAVWCEQWETEGKRIAAAIRTMSAKGKGE